MPVFAAHILDADPDSNALLASILHATPEDRLAARKRGEARLRSGFMQDTTSGEKRKRNTGKRIAAFG